MMAQLQNCSKMVGSEDSEWTTFPFRGEIGRLYHSFITFHIIFFFNQAASIKACGLKPCLQLQQGAESSPENGTAHIWLVRGLPR